jgi:thiol-disulfide isomerase/thioredoxin
MKGQFLAAILLLTFVPPATASDETQLKPFERGSWQQLLRSHRGHPTLVQFWSVTCGPCKVELPQLGEFMKGHPAIDVVTVSADLVPDLPDATRSMLQKSGLSAADNWIFSDGFADRLRFEVDPAWLGDIPRTLLISRDGAITTIEGS